MKGIFIGKSEATEKLAQKLKFGCGMDAYRADELDEGDICDIVNANYEHILIEDELYKTAFYEILSRLNWCEMRSGIITMKNGFSTCRLFHLCKGDFGREFPNGLYEKPLDESAITEFFRRAAGAESGFGARGRVGMFFTKIGLSRTLKGYAYLIEATNEVNVEPSLLGNLTKGLYPRIGRKFGVSGSIVERGIRNAVESTVSKGKFSDVANGLYGGNFSKYEKPTNGEFISFISTI